MLLYIEKWRSVEVNTNARQLTHWHTLKVRATQLIISRSGALVTQWPHQQTKASELEVTMHPQDFPGLGACPSDRGRGRSFWDFALSWWKPLTGGDWGIYGYQTSIIHDHRLWISTPHKNKPNFMFLQVSVLTKIVPSPDWFIGLSSVELCSNGAFVKSHTEEVMNQFPLFFLILL